MMCAIRCARSYRAIYSIAGAATQCCRDAGQDSSRVLTTATTEPDRSARQRTHDITHDEVLRNIGEIRGHPADLAHQSGRVPALAGVT
jgi:hypothetical protein